MLTNPKTKTWLAMQSPSSTSLLLWLFSRQTSKKHTSSHFPQVQANQKFQHTLHSFLLRKELGSSLESFSWVHGFTHTKRKKSLHLISYLTLLKQLQQSRTLSLFHSHGSNTKRRKSSQLFSPFHTYGSSNKERCFFQFFSSFCTQLEAKVILALSLQESMFRVKGNVILLIYCPYIYSFLRSFEIVLMVCWR